jgi:3-methyl-2-oxobutanoate hydroxymethyltransferase
MPPSLSGRLYLFPPTIVGRKERLMQEAEEGNGRVTISYLLQKKQKGEKIIMLTAYDYPLAQILDRTGCDIVLVGDSLGMVVLGYPDTLSVTMEEMLHHTKAVARACQRSMVVADMPYLSYHINEEETLKNAGRFFKESRAQAVKIEGGKKRAHIVKHLVEAEIPVMGHIGLTPQSVHCFSGFRVQGKNLDKAKQLIEDALALEDAGAFSLVLEGMPAELARIITAKLHIPTIGIGAGINCDGQVLVTYDLMGYFDRFRPKFVRQYMQLNEELQKAFKQFYKDVKENKFPGPEESYHLTQDVIAALEKEIGNKK